MENGIYVHAIVQNPEQWDNLSLSEIEKRAPYLPICSPAEIERIVSPSNISDILLKYRADSIMSNMRITRTFERRALTVEEDKWTLVDQFNDAILADFKKSIAAPFRESLDEVFFGTLFTDRPNAYCVKTRFGSLVLISEALYMYLYFMTISISRHWTEIGKDVELSTEEYSLLIAMRTMLLKESFDFEMDPRGKPPEKLNDLIENVVKTEMLFVIAHEYAHFLLGHLDDDKLKTDDFSIEISSKEKSNPLTLTFYSVSQQQEFEADRFAIDILCQSPDDIEQVLLFAVSVLSKIKLFESVANLIGKRRIESSHPSPSDRCQELLEIARGVWNKDKLETYEGLNSLLSDYEKVLAKLYERQPSAFTNYGSMYLKQWREGKTKIDRVDY